MADGGANQKPPIYHRIGTGDMVPIYLMAALFDLVSLIPVPVGAIIGQIIMTSIWFLKGINPVGKKYWVWYLVTWVMEFIPVVSALPIFMFGASRMIAISQIEDELEQRGINSEKAKQFVRVAKGRLMKDQIKEMKEKAIWKAGAEKDKKGNITGYDADKMRQKSEKIEKKEADLDKSLKKSPLPVDRQPSFRQKKPNVDGVNPGVEEPA